MKAFELSDEELAIIEGWYSTAAGEWMGGDATEHVALAHKFGFEIHYAHQHDERDET